MGGPPADPIPTSERESLVLYLRRLERSVRNHSKDPNDYETVQSVRAFLREDDEHRKRWREHRNRVEAELARRMRRK